jgi:ParE-like toxin of type II bacterial toxin-antitoxin system
MNVWQTARFKRTYKRLRPNSVKRLNHAIEELKLNPFLGEKKVGDLDEFYVYKFKEREKLWLLAYRVNLPQGIELIDLGVHENFYRGLRGRRGISAQQRWKRRPSPYRRVKNQVNLRSALRRCQDPSFL